MKAFSLVGTMLLAMLVAPAFADTLTFTNQGNLSGNISTGTVVSGISGLTLGGAPIFGFPVGTVSFNTGSFTGSFQSGGSFTGGDLAIALDGGAILFESAISGTWTKLSNNLYELVGTFAGVIDGLHYSGTTTQFFAFSGEDDHHRFGKDDGCSKLLDLYGTTTITTTTVPEPGTLTFLGTGLIAAAGVVRRKLLAGSRG
jgi:PEP-CTERM motif